MVPFHVTLAAHLKLGETNGGALAEFVGTMIGGWGSFTSVPEEKKNMISTLEP